jgi:prophage tail gpP-like protein
VALIDESQRERLERFSLSIGGKDFTHWTEVELEDSIDGFSTACFTAPFYAEDRDFREMFRPFSYRTVEVKLDNVVQFTGSMVCVEPALDADSRTVKVQAYSRPAVLVDAMIPPDFHGTQWSGLHLLAIAQRLCAPFVITAKFADERSAAAGNQSSFAVAAGTDAELKKALADLEKSFAKVKIEPDGKIFDFLCELVKQRGLVISNDAAGNLVFQKSTYTGAAVAALAEPSEGEKASVPLSVTSHFNPQGYCSHVTTIIAAKRGVKPVRWTAVNPFLRDVLRPTCLRCDDAKPGDAPALAQAHLGRMFGNAASWEVELPTIIDPQGRYYRPNTTLVLKAPSAMIYGRHEFLIRSVTKRQDKDGTTCTLQLVLPGAFSGEVPAALPWNEAL